MKSRTNKSKANKKKKINIKAEINKILKTPQINKTKSCFFEKISKIDKHLARMMRGKNGRQITKTRMLRKVQGTE